MTRRLAYGRLALVRAIVVVRRTLAGCEATATIRKEHVYKIGRPDMTAQAVLVAGPLGVAA